MLDRMIQNISEQLYLFSIIEGLEKNIHFQELNYDWLKELIDIKIVEGNHFNEIIEEASRIASNSVKTNSDRLIAIFPNCDFEGHQQPENITFGKQILSLEEDYFPKSNPKDDPEFCNKFKEELDLLKTNDIRVLAESLLYILEKYGSSISSGFGNDVSFFDFLKIRSGLAICLLDNREECLLIGGGVSGIQPYLYDIVRRRAAKNLKGRSFYIQLLVNQLTEFLLKEMRLFRCNILYSSGGNFYIIIPKSRQDKFIKLKNEFTKKILLTFQSKLTLELDSKLTHYTDLAAKPAEAIEDLNKKIRIQKQAPFKSIMSPNISLEKGINGFNFFFSPQEEGGIAERDAIANEEIGNRKAKKMQNGETVLQSTFDQIEIGGKLKRVDSLSISHNNSGYAPILSNVSFKLDESLNGARKVLKLNELDFIEKENFDKIQGFLLYGGNEAPILQEDKIVEGKVYKKGNVKLFEHLAEGTGRFTRLGYLRMDIDSLGERIQSVFKASSLARISTFSRSLDYFFKGYLNSIWRNNEDFCQYTQIIYSGGDDLFIVGRWDLMIEFAKKIRRDFKEWVGYHSGFTISGGLVLVTHKFPISKAAIMAGFAEDSAKDYSVKNNGKKVTLKDAISILGIPLHWEYDLPEVELIKSDLLKYIKNNDISKALLSNIQHFYSIKRETQIINSKLNAENKPLLPEAWRWRMAYSITRASKRVKGSHAAKAFLQKLSLMVFSNGRFGNIKPQLSRYDFFDLLNIAARWTELELRKDNE